MDLHTQTRVRQKGATGPAFALARNVLVSPPGCHETLPPIILALLLFGCRTNESPEDQLNDLEITTQLKSKLASDIGVSSVTNISVNSTNGVVTLSGQVDSETAKSKAAALAMAAPKVVRVLNNLQIVTRKVAIACCGQSSSFS
jgi:BON domain-containing protein